MVRNWDRPSPERVRTWEHEQFLLTYPKEPNFSAVRSRCPPHRPSEPCCPGHWSEVSQRKLRQPAPWHRLWISVLVNLMKTLKLTQIFHNLFFFRATTSSSFTSSVVPGPGEASLAQQTTTTTTKCWYNAKIDRKMALAQRWWKWRLSTLFLLAIVLNMCEIDPKSQLS